MIDGKGKRVIWVRTSGEEKKEIERGMEGEREKVLFLVMCGMYVLVRVWWLGGETWSRNGKRGEGATKVPVFIKLASFNWLISSEISTHEPTK
jgi:hypothetical protein